MQSSCQGAYVMKTRSLSMIIATACVALVTSSAARAASDQSPFLGKWQLDLTRMPDNYGPPPKRVTFAFEPVDADQWRTTVDIFGRDDSLRHMAVQYRRDGRMVQAEGDKFEAD